MVRRNRKKKKSNGFIFPVPFAGVVVLVSTLALGYVWLGCRCECLGRELKVLETEKTTLMKRYLNEKSRWTRMKSPGNMEKALIRHKIVMTWPRRDQVVRFYETGMVHPGFDEAAQDALKYARLERVVMNE